jgi:hypothetical protein
MEGAMERGWPACAPSIWNSMKFVTKENVNAELDQAGDTIPPFII